MLNPPQKGSLHLLIPPRPLEQQAEHSGATPGCWCLTMPSSSSRSFRCLSFFLNSHKPQIKKRKKKRNTQTPNLPWYVEMTVAEKKKKDNKRNITSLCWWSSNKIFPHHHSTLREPKARLHLG